METTKEDQEMSDAFDRAADQAQVLRVPEETTVAQIFAKMDWKLLRNQKCLLSGMVMRSAGNELLTEEEWEALQGILALLDAIQDAAVADLNLDEALVFGESEEDPEILDYLNNHGQGPEEG
jgi:hypothetical protein